MSDAAKNKGGRPKGSITAREIMLAITRLEKEIKKLKDTLAKFVTYHK